VLSYDYTVLAGTQGALGHRKKDRPSVSLRADAYEVVDCPDVVTVGDLR
jgi:hypothetical protein